MSRASTELPPPRTHDAGRIHALDGLRGVASLVVLVLHAAMMLELWGSDAPYALIPGTPAVILFFVLSGVVLSLAPLSRLHAREPYDWLAYYPRRVARLGIPLCAAVILGIVGGYVAWRLGSTGRSATAIAFDGGATRVVHDVLMQFDVLFNISDDAQTLFGTPLTRVNSPIWSMCWEMWFSLTLPLAIACLARTRHEALTASVLLVAIFISHWCGYFPLRLCLTFWLGVLLARHAREIARARLAPAAELVTLAVLLGIIELAQANAAGLLDQSGALPSALLATAMNAACVGLVALSMTDGVMRRALSMRPVRFLGTISFSLYLTHAVVIGGLDALLPRVGITDPIVQATVGIVLSFDFAVVFWRLFEKPSIELSRRLGESSRRP